MKQLRPYQQEAVQECWQALRESDDPVLLMASVGAGKSLMLASILQTMERAGKRALCLVNNAELVRNNCETYVSQCGNASIYCAALSCKDSSAPIIFGTPQSVLNGITKNESIANIKFNIIVVDECFPGETLIDGNPIKDLKVGDYVRSFNHQTNNIEIKKVLRVFKKKSPHLFCIINLSHGVIICTLEHPVFVKNKGYIKAHCLNNGDEVYVDRCSMHELQKRDKDRESPAISIKKIWSRILLKVLWKSRTRENNEIFCQNEIKKSNGRFERKEKDDCNVEKDRSQTKKTGWKWSRIYRSTKKIIIRITRWLAGGICNKNKIKFQRWLPPSLQNRYSQSTFNDSDRNRWTFTFDFEKTRARYKKRKAIEISRVENVEIHEQRNIFQLYPDINLDYVYNLEVEGNNNYFANQILVHNCHVINYVNHRSGFMRILRYYKQLYPNMRLLGATGTNFRFKGAAIVGEHCLFKKQTGNITTQSLIDRGYLIRPTFEVDKNLVIDFSSVKIKQNGLFDQKQLEKIIDKNTRLTELICYQIIHIMNTQNRFGVFIFATTKKHALEIMTHLPVKESALILGETKQDERTNIINKARKGEIRYLVNISIISVGVDIPAFDTVAYLRPTESLVLLVQTMGRALRLSPETHKDTALILDFAGNIERHKDWDDPILLDALKQIEDPDKPRVIICPRCQEKNTDTARRCVGVNNKVRCDYYFEFKECPNEDCTLKNDIAARYCHTCHAEIIDPNKKLSLSKIKHDENLLTYDVINAKYAISDTHNLFRVNCVYQCKSESGAIKTFYECYTPSSDKAKHVFYGQFIKKHCNNPSDWYTHLGDRKKMVDMIETADIPQQLLIKQENNVFKIKKKIFKDK